MKRIPFISSSRKTALFLFCLLIFPLLNAPAQIPGDVNYSGAVNQIDVTLIMGHILER